MFLFVFSLIVSLLCLHYNKLRITPISGVIVLIIAAIPVINAIAIVVGMAELGYMAYNRNRIC